MKKISTEANIDTTEDQKLATSAQVYASTLTITNDEDYQAAMEEGKRIKDILTKIEAREKEITKPMNDALKSVRALFKPLTGQVELSLLTVKGKMVDYYNAKARAAAEEQRRIEADRRLKAETVATRVAGIDTADKTVKSMTASVTMREDKTWVVVDVSLIPREFLIPDMQAIKASFKNGVPVAGVKEEIIKTPVIK